MDEFPKISRILFQRIINHENTIFRERNVLYLTVFFPNRDRLPFEETNEPDEISLKADTDVLQNALAENDTPYDVSR